MQRFDPKRMRELRVAAGLSQIEAAERAGLAQGRWSEIERGSRAGFTVETLVAIAAALGCGVESLFATAPPKTAKRSKR